MLRLPLRASGELSLCMRKAARYYEKGNMLLRERQHTVMQKAALLCVKGNAALVDFNCFGAMPARNGANHHFRAENALAASATRLEELTSHRG